MMPGNLGGLFRGGGGGNLVIFGRDQSITSYAQLVTDFPPAAGTYGSFGLVTLAGGLSELYTVEVNSVTNVYTWVLVESNSTPEMLQGAGNPNGVVTGTHGQLYRDTGTNIVYVCISSPNGTVWQVV